jgi:transposase
MMDNLRVHHTAIVQQEIRDSGHQLLFRPAYSPDFAPVELAFAKIKGYLRARKYELTDQNLKTHIDEAILTITPDDCRNWFKKCHYYY